MSTAEIIFGVVIIAIVFAIVSASETEHVGEKAGFQGCLCGIVFIILFLVMACSGGCSSKKPDEERICSEEYVFANSSGEPHRNDSCTKEVDEYDKYADATSAEEPQKKEILTEEADEIDNYIYTGPTGEPRWEGTLPEKVNDYTEPRYVYENLVESVDFLPENGRIIGYRISPSLVIHSRVKKGVNPPALGKYISRFGGKLLQDEEISLLQQNREQISKLREKAGDTPIVSEWFWGQHNGIPVAWHYEDDCYKDVIGSSDAYYLLILKR